MNLKNKTDRPNVIWILGEAVRNYGGDDKHSMYEIMEKIIPEGISFKNMVVSAPSTVMSQSSIMTSNPSVFISRTYAEFNFDSNKFNSLSSILKNKGYNIYTTTYYAEGRKLLKPIVQSLDQNEIPSNIKNDDNWQSEYLNQILDDLISKGLSEPFFLLLNYNNQENTGKLMEMAIKKIKDAGLFKNSFFVFCPDHGWPIEEHNKLRRHDCWLTDSNILIPFFIRYPGCEHFKSDGLVSSLDIVPTILNLLNIPSEDYGFKGESLLSLINNHGPYSKKMFRTDIRYLFQAGRSVSIRNDKFKYVYNFDNDSNQEELFNLVNDSCEKINLLKLSDEEIDFDVLSKFRDEFDRSEGELVDFHVNYLSNKFRDELIKLFEEKNFNFNNILVMGIAHPLFVESILKGLKEFKDDLGVDIVVDFNEISKETVGKYGLNNIYDLDIESKLFKEGKKIVVKSRVIKEKDLENKHPTFFKRKYSLVFVPLDNPYGKGKKEIYEILKKMRFDNVFFLDYNMKMKKKMANWFVEGIKLLYLKKNYYLKNPNHLMIEIKKYIRNFI